jgi:DNA-binding HxlR family transcriptional regulator
MDGAPGARPLGRAAALFRARAVLRRHLRALETEGVVKRHSYAESPPRVEYELTEKGAALLPIIEEMRRFGHVFLTD